MADTRIPPAEPGAALLRAGRFFRSGATAPDRHSIALTGGREADAFCQTDHPPVDPDRPEYEPRGCPRGAAFKGGLVRASRDDAVEIVAAAHVHTIRTSTPSGRTAPTASPASPPSPRGRSCRTRRAPASTRSSAPRTKET